MDTGTSAPTPYDPLTGLTWDTRLSGTQIGVYLYPAGVSVTSGDGTVYTTTPFNDYQSGRFEAALTLFSNITKLTFTGAPIPEQAAIRFFQADIPLAKDETKVLLGFAFPPGFTGVAGLQGYNSAAPGWSDAPGGTLESGGNAFTTLIHEMGHGFGLAHPHDDGGGSTIFPGVTSDESPGTVGLNQGIYTMMSYRDGWADGPADLPPLTRLYGEEGTPMALDIAVLQAKYGANTAYRTGDDVYRLPDQNVVGTGYACLWDAGGSNTIEYDGTGAVTIDLRPATLQYAEGGGGYVSYVHGIRGGYTIAAGVTIGTAVSGAGDDVLHGNDTGSLLGAGGGANTIMGGLGNDTIVAAGADVIAAGAGQNQIFMSGSSMTAVVQGQDTIVAGAGSALVGVKTGGSALVFGGAGALTFVGGAASSTVVGGAGSATIFGGAGGGLLAAGRGGNSVVVSGTGAATLFGGGNGDALFAQGTNQVIVAGAGNETLSGSGSGGNAYFGSGGTVLIAAGSGNDAIIAGTGQATVFGGAGADLFVFKNGGGGGRMLIGDFNVADGDRLGLQGFGAGAVQAALSTAVSNTVGTTITLSDRTTITLAGVANLQASAFL